MSNTNETTTGERKMNWKFDGKNGALTKYKISCPDSDTAHAVVEKIKNITTYSVTIRENDVVYGCGSRSDLREIDEMLGSFKTTKTSVATKTSVGRVLVEMGKTKIGDIINGHEVTGLGNPWKMGDDETELSFGISGGAEYIQYAYFN